METKGKANDPKSWDDMVFENRNTDYGAYSVRKSYNGNLTSGFLLSVSFGGLLFVVPTIMSLFDDEEMMVQCPDVVLRSDTIVFEQKPFIKTTPPPAPRYRTAVTPPTPPVPNTQVKVTTDAPDNLTIPTADDLQQSPPSEPEGPSGPDGVEGGTGTGPSDVIPSGGGGPEGEWFNPSVAASYTGGLNAMYEFIRRKMNYPASARRMGIEGTVYVSFVIGRDGKVTKVEVIKGLSPDCDKEAARVIALLPGWNPGRQNDVPVMVRMTLPIKFALDK